MSQCGSSQEGREGDAEERGRVAEILLGHRRAGRAGHDVPLAEVRDVSRCLNRETGVFEWPDAPAGKWRIFRVGYVPKVFGWMGCYIDHTSRAAFDAHWARVMTPLLEALAPDERAALKGA